MQRYRSVFFARLWDGVSSASQWATVDTTTAGRVAQSQGQEATE